MNFSESPITNTTVFKYRVNEVDDFKWFSFRALEMLNSTSYLTSNKIGFIHTYNFLKFNDQIVSNI